MEEDGVAPVAFDLKSCDGQVGKELGIHAGNEHGH